MRTYAEISLDAIVHNINEIRSRVPSSTKVLAVVKANAYGHGAVPVAKALENQVDYFAVATLEEALQLRENGIALPILILAYTSPMQYPELIENEICTSIYNEEEAAKLDDCAQKLGKQAHIHIALDTGMTRIGFQINENEADRIAAIAKLPNVRIEGMFTHLSCADQQDKNYCIGQFAKYDRMLEMLHARGVSVPIRHIYNSAASMEFPVDEPHHYDMVRAGITNYGCYPSEDVQKQNIHLEPTLAWRAHVIHVKDVPEGVGVGYGATYVTSRPCTRIATVSVGYADGYPRALSSKGRVLIHGQYAPILGRVCMDQMMVDISAIDNVKPEDVVTLIGTDGGHTITVEEVADNSASFNYEQFCKISPRVARVYVDGFLS